MTLLKHVDLCSGIGGFSLGFRMAQLSNPILFCDIEPWCRKILTQHWPDVPIYEDVKEIANDPERFIPRRPDILTVVVLLKQRRIMDLMICEPHTVCQILFLSRIRG